MNSVATSLSFQTDGRDAKVGIVGKETIHLELVDQKPMCFVERRGPLGLLVFANRVGMDEEPQLLGHFDYTR